MLAKVNKTWSILTSAMAVLILLGLPGRALASNAVNPSDPMQFWERVAVSEVPDLVPEGKLADFTLALQRQIENCREYREGRMTKCSSESSLVKLYCHEATLNKMLDIVKSSKNWESLFARAKTSFVWYRYKGGKAPDQVLFTAYNAPLYEASLKKTEKYRYPLYSRPSDLIDMRNEEGRIIWRKKLPDGSITLYDERKTIDVDHSLKGKGLEVAFMENPLDIMRLQQEGSGVLKVKDANGNSKEVGANYAGQNGRPQVSIAKWMRAKGIEEKYLNFSGQKKYFAEHPEDLWPALVTNPSYVFFSVTGEPPCGTARVHLTPGHTLAVDPTHVGLGSMVLIDTKRPIRAVAENNNENSENNENANLVGSKVRFTRFAFAQDTGGPVKGAHVDTYWGTGEYAQYLSDGMSERGTMFLPLVPETDR